MRILVGIMIVLTLSGGAFAENFLTANTVGQGKWSLLAGAMTDSNTWAQPEFSGNSLTGLAEYGLTKQFDVIFSAGEWVMAGIPVEASVINLGVSGKYAFVNESSNSPAIAGLIGYKAHNQYGLGSNTGSQLLAGFIASKNMATFNNYCSATYRTIAYPDDSLNYTQIDLNLGTSIAWSKEGSLFAEYTMQMITPKVVNQYTSSQIGVGVGYNL